MSATTERLLEEIKAVETALAAAKAGNRETEVVRLTWILTDLNDRLNIANKTLNEGLSLLKG